MKNEEKPNYFSADQMLRVEALQAAVRHPTSHETDADSIVKAAEKYYTFLNTASSATTSDPVAA